MGLKDFYIEQGAKFAESELKMCPMCGTSNPNWEVGMKLGKVLTLKPSETSGRNSFTCSNCKCVLSVSMADLSDRNKKLTNQNFIMAAAKKAEGKKLMTSYVRIENIGSVQVNPRLEGEEYTVDQINQMAYEASNSYRMASSSNQVNNSAVEELKKYKELLDMGAISQIDYDMKKMQILGF